jgi:hypothetical protein
VSELPIGSKTEGVLFFDELTRVEISVAVSHELGQGFNISLPFIEAA